MYISCYKIILKYRAREYTMNKCCISINIDSKIKNSVYKTLFHVLYYNIFHILSD